MTPKHPEITVTLTGQDGNAFAILGRCRAAARDAGLSDDEIAAFMAEAMEGDYDQLLQTAMRWFEIR
jgi:ABC-type sugar transport system substrate-binding protein